MQPRRGARSLPPTANAGHAPAMQIVRAHSNAAKDRPTRLRMCRAWMYLLAALSRRCVAPAGWIGQHRCQHVARILDRCGRKHLQPLDVRVPTLDLFGRDAACALR